MAGRFSSFIVFGEMRTGSNFLEASINQFADLHCHGELFNPVFVGGAKKDSLFGISKSARDKDPLVLIDAIKAADPKVLPGFRFFSDHDPRVFEACLSEPSCAKVVLTRNPLDSYVSRKIASETGQWKLTNEKHRKTAKIQFDAIEFERSCAQAQAFQIAILRGLQTTGQTAFYINYDDLNEIDVINGLARFLGSRHQADHVSLSLKKQNPSALEEKVENHAEMVEAISRMDFMNLSRTPNFEPRRGAGVPGFVAGQSVPVLILPIKGGPFRSLMDWLAAQDGCAPDELQSGMNQRDLKAWRQVHPESHSVAVVRHPLLRAHEVFCRYILNPKAGAYRDQRAAIDDGWKLRLPKAGAKAPGYDLAAHRQAFTGFLRFLKANLSGQTTVKIDPAWASQVSVLDGMADVATPTLILREGAMVDGLAALETLAQLPHHPVQAETDTGPFHLLDVWTKDIEKHAREAYARDYAHFGFTDFSSQAA